MGARIYHPDNRFTIISIYTEGTSACAPLEGGGEKREADLKKRRGEKGKERSLS